MMHHKHGISPHDERFLANFPLDPDTVTGKFHLDGKETVYAVCPNSDCHKTYSPTFTHGSPIPIYPKYCSPKAVSAGSECGTRLTRPCTFGNTNVEVPIKHFVAFSFKDFVGGLLSRLGFEDAMDKPWPVAADGKMQDIFDGQFLREFTGDDGLPFRSNKDKSCYFFSLCLAFFNPFTSILLRISKLERRVQSASYPLSVSAFLCHHVTNQKICF